jgi:Na+-transporting NADH:ubiquinone oxidoreductase subunit D
MNALSHALSNPVLRQNPVTTQVLGICAALAITNSLTSALIMSVAMSAVLVFSNVSISLIRRQIPASVRLIVQITIIAAAVTVVDQVLAAYMPEASKRLTVYVSLIVTNCIVLGRAESFAMNHGVGERALDAIGNSLGYSVILIIVATIRELFGNGSLMGYELLHNKGENAWFEPVELLMLSPSAFFIIGLIVWVIRCWKPEQRERGEFPPRDVTVEDGH